ncbi:MAG: HD domain-containing protein [Actinobacteria bacterium]|nr:HD domain-containing protein [Actinomycetota bacterium]
MSPERRFSGQARVEVSFLAGVIVVPVGAFAVLRLVPGLDLLFQSSLFHVIVVSLIAACALQVAVLATAAAARSREPAPVFLALGCLAVGILMLGHGLTTPGIADRPMNLWVARLPVIALAAFAGALALALLPPRSAPMRLARRHPRATLAVPGIAMAAWTAWIVVTPTSLWGDRPFSVETSLQRGTAVVVTAILVAAGVAYWRRWRLSRDPVALSLVAACWLAASAELSLNLGVLWQLSWWDYHVLLLVGFGAAVYAVVGSYRRSRRIEETLASLFATEPLEQIARSYPDALRALVAAVEAKDGYTHGHSARVAAMSVRIGQRLSLRPAALRRLAQGALLHDIGKIGIPDDILNKPDALTPDERARIEDHPIVGWDIVRQAASLREALAAIRHHHERVDGTGYPDGLRGHAIPLEARIVAVADVWDALTSDRAYRPAWTPDRAIEHMAAVRGTHFDPSSLDAFLEIMADQGIRPTGRGGDADRILEAAEACHVMEDAPEHARAAGAPLARA